MKLLMTPQNGRRLAAMAFAAAVAAAAPNAKANVYATNIKLNGSLTGTTNAQGAPVSISYILNEPATLGTTIAIRSGATLVNTLSVPAGQAGTLRGLNTVVWGGTNNSGVAVGPGSYSIAITPVTSGYTNWTQISVDSDPGMPAYFPWGIDVDKNTNSLYYGRVVMSCANGNGAVPAKDGLYKMNADGSQADEGWFGFAGYTMNDAGQTAEGQMGPGNWHNPEIIRIGEDDRIYWMDNSAVGTVAACDMLASTNQIVITSGAYVDQWGDVSHYGGPNNYENCPLISYLAVGGWGIRQFDVCGLGTTNAAVYLVDSGDYPSWGVWMFHLTNGVSDPNDTVGTRLIATGGSDFAVTSAGLMVDYNLDVFVSQGRSNAGDPLYRTFCYTNWNGGGLPPVASSMGLEANVVGTSAWQVGSADSYMTAIWDTAINSRSHPTIVAVAMVNGATVAGGYNGKNGGIRLLNAVDGSVLVTNIDIGNWYNSVAFDNVGNVYGCSRSTNLWRIWSPPGTNQATTVAVGNIQIQVPVVITSLSVAGDTVTIHFTGSDTDAAGAFTLLSSANVGGSYTAATGASITGSAGSFTATVPTSGAAQFYRIKR